MTSGRRGPNAKAEPLYSLAVFERLRESLDVQFRGDAVVAGDDGYIRPNYEIRDDGAWLRASDVVDSLNWTPACDLSAAHDSPDPLTTPALPFPFTARYLAAFMLDGWGWFLHQRFVGADGLLDVETAQALLGGVRDAKPREAIEAALAALVQARHFVGEPDADLAKAENVAASAFAEANNDAERLHDWRAKDISEQERDARVQRRNAMTDSATAALRQAQAAQQEDHKAWRTRMVLWLLGAGDRKYSRDEWRALLKLEQASAFLAGHAPDASPEEERHGLVDWYDATVRADYWFGLASVTAVEAAQLLSCENPHDPDSANWLETTTEHLNPEAKRELLRGLEDEGGKRPLTEWLQRAKSRGWRYDPWIEQYIEAAGLSPTAAATEVGTSTRPVPRAIAQENAILAKFRELGIDPMRLPKPKPGKSSPPVSQVRAALGPSYTADVMQKAMSRLFQDGRAAYSDTSAD